MNIFSKGMIMPRKCAFDTHGLSGTKAKQKKLGTYANKEILKELGFTFPLHDKNGHDWSYWCTEINLSESEIDLLKNIGIGFGEPMFMAFDVIEKKPKTEIKFGDSPIFKSKIKPEYHQYLKPWE